MRIEPSSLMTTPVPSPEPARLRPWSAPSRRLDIDLHDRRLDLLVDLGDGLALGRDGLGRRRRRWPSGGGVERRAAPVAPSPRRTPSGSPGQRRGPDHHEPVTAPTADDARAADGPPAPRRRHSSSPTNPTRGCARNRKPRRYARRITSRARRSVGAQGGAGELGRAGRRTGVGVDHRAAVAADERACRRAPSRRRRCGRSEACGGSRRWRSTGRTWSPS